MQVIVLGAGAMGSLFGAKLAAQNDVTLVGRPAHVAAINTEGLRLEGLEPQVVKLRAATQLESIKADALILLTTKVPDTAVAIAPMAALVRADTTILSLQNGLDSEQVARRALRGRGVVLRGIMQVGAIFESPGVIRYTVAGVTRIQEHERSAHIAEIFNAAGLECHISPDITRDVWRKLTFNCVVNPITAILGCEVGGIVDPRLDPLKRAVVDECTAVAAAEGVTFALDPLTEINRVYAGSHNIVSMLQDLRRGRRTEIDYLNGAVAGRAAKHDLLAPANAGLTSLIKALELRALTAPKENAPGAGD